MNESKETQNILKKINENFLNREREKEKNDENKPREVIHKRHTHEENDDHFQGKVKMKNYTTFNSSIQEKELISYYCALCGALGLITNQSLEKMPLRATDGAISINRKEVFCKLYLKKSGCMYIKRAKGLEPQFRWRCECGVLIGYQAISFEDSDALIAKGWQEEEENEKNIKNKSFLYILNDAIVLNMHASSLIQRLSEYMKTGK